MIGKPSTWLLVATVCCLCNVIYTHRCEITNLGIDLLGIDDQGVYVVDDPFDSNKTFLIQVCTPITQKQKNPCTNGYGYTLYNDSCFPISALHTTYENFDYTVSLADSHNASLGVMIDYVPFKDTTMNIILTCEDADTTIFYIGATRQWYHNQSFVTVHHFTGTSSYACPQNRTNIWIYIVVIVVLMAGLLGSLFFVKGCYNTLNKHWRRDSEEQSLLSRTYDQAPQLAIMTFDGADHDP